MEPQLKTRLISCKLVTGATVLLGGVGLGAWGAQIDSYWGTSDAIIPSIITILLIGLSAKLLHVFVDDLDRIERLITLTS